MLRRLESVIKNKGGHMKYWKNEKIWIPVVKGVLSFVALSIYYLLHNMHMYAVQFRISLPFIHFYDSISSHSWILQSGKCMSLQFWPQGTTFHLKPHWVTCYTHFYSLSATTTTSHFTSQLFKIIAAIAQYAHKTWISLLQVLPTVSVLSLLSHECLCLKQRPWIDA